MPPWLTAKRCCTGLVDKNPVSCGKQVLASDRGERNAPSNFTLNWREPRNCRCGSLFRNRKVLKYYGGYSRAFRMGQNTISITFLGMLDPTHSCYLGVIVKIVHGFLLVVNTKFGYYLWQLSCQVDRKVAFCRCQMGYPYLQPHRIYTPRNLDMWSSPIEREV
jgi:hypothetical protein